MSSDACLWIFSDMFDDLQLFVVFEFADGGRDLETCQVKTTSDIAKSPY